MTERLVKIIIYFLLLQIDEPKVELFIDQSVISYDEGWQIQYRRHGIKSLLFFL